MAGPPKFQITSRKWNVATVVGAILILAIGFGGLFYIQSNVKPTGGVTLAFVIGLGILTALLFISPGALYPFRKRTAFGKKIMPGGTMTWIRSHMYLPILALIAGIVHASVVPFLTHLTSGVILLVLGVLVSIGGLARHHMIGLKKEALNVNVAINKMAQGQPKAFRDLVLDFVENRRPIAEIDAQVAKLDPGEQLIWREIRKMSDDVAKNFPREGGQTSKVLQFQSWRALHPIITIAFFAVLVWHVWDVLGGTQAAFGDEKTAFVASDSCADCHSEIVEDWKLSSMSEAQTGTIMEAQLPITIGENETLAETLGADQQAIFDSSAKSCINCHVPVGAPFAQDITALLPFDAEGSAADGGVAVSGGNASVQSDGIGCISCHTQEAPPAELAGFGPIPVASQSANNFGIQYGPLFEDPDPVPVPKHGMDPGTDDWWSTTVESSQLCGACHNVKVDIDGDGLSPIEVEAGSTDDTDGNFILDENELDDDDGELDDLVLQTTYDEWQDYVAGFEARILDDPRNSLEAPLGCNDCHMPLPSDGDQPIVDFAPGLLSRPDRTYRSHMFVGVDYDLDVEHYEQSGFPDDALDRVLDARAAAPRIRGLARSRRPGTQRSRSVSAEGHRAEQLARAQLPDGLRVRPSVLARGHRGDCRRPTGLPRAAVDWHRHAVWVGSHRVRSGRASSVRSREHPASARHEPELERSALRPGDRRQPGRRVHRGLPGERLRSVAHELPEDPHRRRSDGRGHVCRSAVPGVPPEHRQDPRAASPRSSRCARSTRSVRSRSTACSSTSPRTATTTSSKRPRFRPTPRSS